MQFTAAQIAELLRGEVDGDPQVLVNGSQIVLRHAGDEYHYHSGRGREPFYCAKPQNPLPADAGGLDDT